MSSLVYGHPLVYDLVMELLYGGQLGRRYQQINAWIPDGAQVIEHCCGSAHFFRRVLRRRPVSWRGYDIHAGFIRWGRRRGLAVARGSVWDDNLPIGEWVLLQGSLCQFMPDHRRLIDRLRRSALIGLIIAEPIRNLASHPNPFVRALAQHAADFGAGPVRRRFDRAALQGLAASYGDDLLGYHQGPREDILAIRGQGSVRVVRA